MNLFDRSLCTRAGVREDETISMQISISAALFANCANVGLFRAPMLGFQSWIPPTSELSAAAAAAVIFLVQMHSGSAARCWIFRIKNRHAHAPIKIQCPTTWPRTNFRFRLGVPHKCNHNCTLCRRPRYNNCSVLRKICCIYYYADIKKRKMYKICWLLPLIDIFICTK